MGDTAQAFQGLLAQVLVGAFEHLDDGLEALGAAHLRHADGRAEHIDLQVLLLLGGLDQPVIRFAHGREQLLVPGEERCRQKEMLPAVNIVQVLPGVVVAQPPVDRGLGLLVLVTLRQGGDDGLHGAAPGIHLHLLLFLPLLHIDLLPLHLLLQDLLEVLLAPLGVQDGQGAEALHGVLALTDIFEAVLALAACGSEEPVAGRDDVLAITHILLVGAGEHFLHTEILDLLLLLGARLPQVNDGQGVLRVVRIALRVLVAKDERIQR